MLVVVWSEKPPLKQIKLEQLARGLKRGQLRTLCVCVDFSCFSSRTHRPPLFLVFARHTKTYPRPLAKTAAEFVRNEVHEPGHFIPGCLFQSGRITVPRNFLGGGRRVQHCHAVSNSPSFLWLVQRTVQKKIFVLLRVSHTVGNLQQDALFAYFANAQYVRGSNAPRTAPKEALATHGTWGGRGK